MSSPIDVENARDPEALLQERRKYGRHLGTALVEIVRESDCRRMGLPVSLVNVSVAGVGLLADEPFARHERVKVILRNQIRRFLKEMPGIVRWSQAAEKGKFRIGSGLNGRVAGRDWQRLERIGTAGGGDQKVWI